MPSSLSWAQTRAFTREVPLRHESSSLRVFASKYLPVVGSYRSARPRVLQDIEIAKEALGAPAT
eukprot:9718216-Alexandrium_andersonii.AAC.1